MVALVCFLGQSARRNQCPLCPAPCQAAVLPPAEEVTVRPWRERLLPSVCLQPRGAQPGSKSLLRESFPDDPRGTLAASQAALYSCHCAVTMHSVLSGTRGGPRSLTECAGQKEPCGTSVPKHFFYQRGKRLRTHEMGSISHHTLWLGQAS